MILSFLCFSHLKNREMCLLGDLMSEKLREQKALSFFSLHPLEDLEKTKGSTALNVWFCAVTVL